MSYVWEAGGPGAYHVDPQPLLFTRNTMMKYSSCFRCHLVQAAFSSLVFLGLLSAGAGCSKKEEKPAPAAEPTPEASVEKPAETPKPLALGHVYSVGPRLVLMPGKGAGAIRFGATVETIERHMEGPCDKVTAERCLYARQAVEFFLTDGKVSRIKAHRRDRKVTDPAPGKDEYFGTLAGIVQPTILLGLHRHVVLEEYGEPSKKEEVSPPGPDGLVDRHYYDGIVFEYDQIENGNIVLAAIEIQPSQTPYVPKVTQPSTGAPKGPPKPEVVR